ncbi:trehalose-phosphatase [Croceicoccus mobilis]|uniref:trehalose-phosphatase n=1 Tax=Croceicoccus mobilis TaxID=1703339 RepID=UPI0008365AB9|nr:trehalose-phosphatase [Croceicoccus mobilis]
MQLPEPPLLDFATDTLFLDFDGTLVELADRPDAITVPDDLIATLHELTDRLNGRLALVSGRALEVLDEFGMAGLAAAGSHGSEWRLAGGERQHRPRPAGLDRARERFTEFATRAEGLLFEDKPLGAALHYRRAPGERDAAHDLAQEMADDHGLHVQRGHDMVELRISGVDKGSAITEMLGHGPFAGHRPVFLGDDVTDEDGFRAVDAHGGAGVLVGEMRPTLATFRLAGVAAVNDWLSRSLRERMD